MERSSKRGKIPQHDWPSIIKRYEAGETLASIARTYDCSPPAISYILSRSRARESAVESAPTEATGSPEARMESGRVSEAAVPNSSSDGAQTNKLKADHLTSENSSSVEDPPIKPQQTASNDPRPDPSPPRNVVLETDETGPKADINALNDEDAQPTSNENQVEGGERRRILHLSPPQEGIRRSDIHHQHSTVSLHSSTSGATSIGRPAEAYHQAPLHPVRGSSEGLRTPANGGSPPMTASAQKARDAYAFIDHALRERVDNDITAFLAAFDAALAEDTPESRARLRDATDRLLRAGARTRIQLERLEARVPLPSRNGQATPSRPGR
jgi:hypothetical protein